MSHDSTGGDEDKKRRKKEMEEDAVDTTIISARLLESNPEKARYLIGVYFRRILREWGKSLTSRPDDEKRTTQGKLQSATQVH